MPLFACAVAHALLILCSRKCSELVRYASACPRMITFSETWTTFPSILIGLSCRPFGNSDQRHSYFWGCAKRFTFLRQVVAPCTIFIIVSLSCPIMVMSSAKATTLIHTSSAPPACAPHLLIFHSLIWSRRTMPTIALNIIGEMGVPLSGSSARCRSVGFPVRGHVYILIFVK